MHYRSESSEASRVTLTVSDIVEHEDYGASGYTNDIMLLRLNEPVQYTAEISPVCLPELGFTPESDHIQCYTTGWGRTRCETILSTF